MKTEKTFKSIDEIIKTYFGEDTKKINEDQDPRSRGIFLASKILGEI